MSGIINKVKEKVAEMKSDSHHGDATSTSTNHGPYDSNMANKADPRIDSDLDGSRNAGLARNTATTTTGTGYTGTSGIGSSGANTTYSGNTSGPNTTAGPHNSDMLNKLDPRVDSDLSGGHPGSNAAYTSTGTTGTTGTTGYGSSTTGTTGYGSSTTAGPHSSNIANRADPRVDSDLSGGHPGSNTAYTSTGTTGYGSNTHGTHGTTGLGSSNTTSTGPNTTAGPHSSDMMNKIDPRVDSDLSGGHPGSNAAYTGAGVGSGIGAGAGTTGTAVGSGAHHGGHHGHHHGHNHGTTANNHYGSGLTGTNEPVHNNATMNKLDPRVDTTGTSGMAGTHHQTHGTQHNAAVGGIGGSGIGNTTGTHGTSGITGSSTGPVHNSSLLNKLDPRVDSDADGSRNAGMTKQSTTDNVGGVYNTGSGATNRMPGEPLDASRHGPTAFKEVHGDPSVHHDFPESSTSGRHGSIGTSDQHYGSGAL